MMEECQAEQLLFIPPRAKTSIKVGAFFEFRIPFQPEAILANSLYFPVNAHDPHVSQSRHLPYTPL
jgi:hypothetical protein